MKFVSRSIDFLLSCGLFTLYKGCCGERYGKMIRQQYTPLLFFGFHDYKQFYRRRWDMIKKLVKNAANGHESL